jgi:hypothetical protein
MPPTDGSNFGSTSARTDAGFVDSLVKRGGIGTDDGGTSTLHYY